MYKAAEDLNVFEWARIDKGDDDLALETLVSTPLAQSKPDAFQVTVLRGNQSLRRVRADSPDALVDFYTGDCGLRPRHQCTHREAEGVRDAAAGSHGVSPRQSAHEAEQTHGLQDVSRTVWKSTSASGAVLARSSGEEPASSRHERAVKL